MNFKTLDDITDAIAEFIESELANCSPEEKAYILADVEDWVGNEIYDIHKEDS